MGQNRWWDKQCAKVKREARETYKKWKKGMEERDKYLEEKHRSSQGYANKKKKEWKEEMKAIKDLKREFGNT